MLDRLLGRASLKERIEELEEENEHLQRRIDSAERSRAEAVSARQDAEETVNRLEDRVEELEDRVERLQGEDEDLTFRGTEELRGGRLDEVLARLRSVETEPEGALTAMVEDEPSDVVHDILGDRTGLARRAAPCLVLTDDAGVVSVALDPPRAPEAFTEWGDGFRLEASWFRPTERLTVALVRSDLFALGEFDGRELTGAAGFESDVRAKHSKGGFSQARFERRRDQQIADHLDACREAIAERAPETLILLGDAEAIESLADVADETATVDASGDPEEALAAGVREFFTTKLYVL